MLQQLVCATIEKIANKALLMNVQGTQALESLNLKTLTLYLSELGFPLSITFQSNSVMVTSLESSSDCSIHTSMSTLKTLQKEQQLTELIKQEKLDLQGDIKIAQQVATIAEHLHIDWESEISAHIGDYATHKLKVLSQSITQKVKFAQQQISADSTEWLLHESKLIVSKAEINDFTTQVEDVSQKAQALSQRIDKLMIQLSEAFPEKSKSELKPEPEL